MSALGQDLSWLFAGIGDARNFFATLIPLISSEEKGEAPSSRHFHFTLIDLNATAIARVLIMLHLLDQTDDTEALACMIYVFGSYVMPSFAYEKLQQTISALIDGLQRESPVQDWVYLAEHQRPAILHHLHAWKTSLNGKYNTRNLRQSSLKNATISKTRRKKTLDEPEEPLTFCEYDDMLFWTYGIFMPDDLELPNCETELAGLAAILSTGLSTPSSVPDEKALNIIDNTWKPNVTLVDINWDSVRDSDSPHSDPPDFHFDSPAVHKALFNPSEEVAEGFGITSFWGWSNVFFRSVSQAIGTLRERLCVEVVLGEMNDCLERLQHDAWTSRGDKQGKFEPALFPRTYNRIHMSNVP
ncbi:unnamed protein product [Aureobasidium uvarum]|uniref:DUF4470 domain-containing protein n=1 Tax=Aureobasidium uvarum TaxID=2773716 RepID=A0A9N8KIR3_9PEZI|nr:unnamed protein product [Aureobasidium uvarum]